MRKIFLFLIMFLTACQVSAPSQMVVDTEKELVGLQDIPLTNMPGHELPEVPLECICPKMFGLDHNPCCVEDKCQFTWYADPVKALQASEGKKMILVLFTRDDDLTHIKSKKATKDLLSRLAHPHVRQVLDKHYVGLLIKGDQALYNMLRRTSEKPIKWLPEDFSMSPSLMFVKTSEVNLGDRKLVTATSLPMLFEGGVKSDLKDLLTQFYHIGQK